MRTNLPLLFFFLIIGIISSCKNQVPKEVSPEIPPAEILYHLCQRSFYDSNGDSHGDLRGLMQKLDYLQELGITSILLLPLYESVFYHNYFPIDFKKIDPEFGTEVDFLELVKEIHKRDMRIYMDMEVHYITEDHLWFKESYQNPESEYSRYIIYNDSLNEKPESIVWDLKELTGYDSTTKKVMTLNLYDEKCKAYIYDLFKYWLDPNQDGNFEDGVDGYRIDHMMDDLDWKNGLIPNMLTEFWQPLIAELKSINPDITIMGEQAEWDDYGADYFKKAELDWVFAFGAKSGINNFDKAELISKYDSAFAITPEGKNQVIFIENHDVTRFATQVENQLPKMKVGAAFNLLLKGIPSIYYGQEIGMKGLNNQYKNIDGNHIPLREAFEWYEKWDKPGMALWYKDTGPWWTNTSLKNSDGISYEEQKKDENSLWHFYKKLIELRKSHIAISEGDMYFFANGNEAVVSMLRNKLDQFIFININLSNQMQNAAIATSAIEGMKLPFKTLLGEADYQVEESKLKFQLKPFEVQVLKIQN